MKKAVLVSPSFAGSRAGSAMGERLAPPRCSPVHDLQLRIVAEWDGGDAGVWRGATRTAFILGASAMLWTPILLLGRYALA